MGDLRNPSSFHTLSLWNPLPPLPSRPPRDRTIAISMVALAALLASAWIMRERQLSTDLAESREDLRQAMHRLQTLSSSTDQIRVAYLQRKQELDLTKQKLAQASSRPAEEKNKTPLTPRGKIKNKAGHHHFLHSSNPSQTPLVGRRGKK